MTKLESAKMIVKQNGSCRAKIDCSDCFLAKTCCDDIGDNLKLAKEYIAKYGVNMVLVSNDKVHWKERELATIYDGHCLCHTEDGSYKIWRHMKELPITETRHQYLYKSPNGVYLTTPHVNRGDLDASEYIRIDESALEFEL